MTGDSPREPSRRTRSPPSRGRGSRHWLWALVVAALLVGAAVPAASYDTARLDRMSGINVVTDTDALLGIDHAQTVSKQSNTLVVVTNRFPEERVITVSLTTCTVNALSLTTFGGNSSGVLVSNDGSSVTFSLPAGGSQAVTIALNDVQCDPIVTQITTTDGLTQVTAEREAGIKQGSNGNNGKGNGNGNKAIKATGVLGDD